MTLLKSPKSPLSELSHADSDWLTNTLMSNGLLIQGCVASVTHDTWQKTLYSIIGRLRVSYSTDVMFANGAAPPATFVLKLSKPAGTTKRVSPLAHREFEFYSKIAPVMDRAPNPRCYDAVFDPASGQYHFLLEDLSATHTHVGNPLPPSTLACEQIMACMAHFHAAWWNDPRIGTEIGKPYREERWHKRAATVGKHTDKFLALLADRISVSRRDVLLDLCEVFPRLLERQRSGPLTITHGDAHFQNILVAPGHADCRIIDWEDWEPAPATDDLAFMMAVLWFPERRQRLEQDLLRCYHRTLLASGVSVYAWDALWSDYRLSVIKRLCTPVYQWVNGVGAAQWWNNLERVLTAYDDLGCAEMMQQLKHTRGT